MDSCITAVFVLALFQSYKSNTIRKRMSNMCVSGTDIRIQQIFMTLQYRSHFLKIIFNHRLSQQRLIRPKQTRQSFHQILWKRPAVNTCSLNKVRHE
jgi:hypothetical protein